MLRRRKERGPRKMMEIVLMKNVVERKLRLGMKLRSGCMRLLGRLVSRLGARVRWVNLGMLGVEEVSFKSLVRMNLRGWSRIGGGRGCMYRTIGRHVLDFQSPECMQHQIEGYARVDEYEYGNCMTAMTACCCTAWRKGRKR